MGALISSLVTTVRSRAPGWRIAVVEHLPVNLYHLEERAFPEGAFYDENLSVRAEVKGIVERLGVHEWAVAQLWRQFQQMAQKQDPPGATLWEFREYFDLPDDKTTTRLYRCFDEDRNYRMSFLEFIIGLWTYCCDCNSSLVCLAFDLYDRDHDGQVSLDEADRMIIEVFGKDWRKNKDARNAHNWLHSPTGVRIGKEDMEIEDFAVFAKEHASVMFIAQKLRHQIQSKAIGRAFWNHMLGKEVEVYVGRRMRVEEVLQAHTDAAAVDRVATDGGEDSHNDLTQATLKAIRRTGPFPRRRRFRGMEDKKSALKSAKYSLLSVREAFARVVVAPGEEDDPWDDAVTPSAVEALKGRLNVARGLTGGGAGGGGSGNPLSREELTTQKRKTGKAAKPGASTRTAPAALAKLKVAPGLNGTPLGSPAASDAASAGGEGGPGSLGNAFGGLMAGSESLARPASAGGPHARDPLRVKPSADKAARPRPVNLQAAGPQTLSRTGKDMVKQKTMRQPLEGSASSRTLPTRPMSA